MFGKRIGKRRIERVSRSQLFSVHAYCSVGRNSNNSYIIYRSRDTVACKDEVLLSTILPQRVSRGTIFLFILYVRFIYYIIYNNVYYIPSTEKKKKNSWAPLWRYCRAAKSKYPVVIIII